MVPSCRDGRLAAGRRAGAGMNGFQRVLVTSTGLEKEAQVGERKCKPQTDVLRMIWACKQTTTKKTDKMLSVMGMRV